MEEVKEVKEVKEIRDPRCAEGNCDFPVCNCLYPPHEIPLRNPGRDILIGICLACFIALAISFGWFYLVNEVL